MRKIYIYRNGNENDVQRFFEKADVKTQSKFKSILAYISNERNPLCSRMLSIFRLADTESFMRFA